MSIQIEIDGMTVTTEEGRTLVDVAAEAGVYIPTLCYIKGQPCLGTCRVCSVKVNGSVAAACTVRVSDGLAVEVDEPETTDMPFPGSRSGPRFGANLAGAGSLYLLSALCGIHSRQGHRPEGLQYQQPGWAGTH